VKVLVSSVIILATNMDGHAEWVGIRSIIHQYTLINLNEVVVGVCGEINNDVRYCILVNTRIF
jgi:hypothetical protein